MTKLHFLINKDSHTKYVRRRCLTAVSSEDIFNQHIDRCQNEEPTNVTFSWKDHLNMENHYIKIPLPIRVYADFECINQTQNKPNTAKLASNTEITLCNPKVSFKQIPIAVGYYLISPLGNNYNSYFGGGSVKWFVNKMMTQEKMQKLSKQT